MMDAEAAYVEHEQNMQIQEELIRHVIRTVLDKCNTELEVLERDTETLRRADAPFKRMTHYEAIEYLRAHGSEITHGSDLGAQDEVLLTEGSDVPVFVEKWPKEIKAFYMKRDPNNPELVLGNDLIAPEGFGEKKSSVVPSVKMITTSCLPECRPKTCQSSAYQWFLDLRKYRLCPPQRIWGWIGTGSSPG